MLAWQANLMAFMPYNQTEPGSGLKVLTDRIKRYPPNVTVAQNKLKINYKGGFDLVDLDHICFCSGSGNYTEIYLQNGKKKCISYPLSKIEQRLKGVTFLDRIGKSFIINYNRVQSVKSELVVFRGEATFELNLSQTYIKRIKQNLLWY